MIKIKIENEDNLSKKDRKIQSLKNEIKSLKSLPKFQGKKNFSKSTANNNEDDLKKLKKDNKKYQKENKKLQKDLKDFKDRYKNF